MESFEVLEIAFQSVAVLHGQDGGDPARRTGIEDILITAADGNLRAVRVDLLFQGVQHLRGEIELPALREDGGDVTGEDLEADPGISHGGQVDLKLGIIERPFRSESHGRVAVQITDGDGVVHGTVLRKLIS
jgi:hypothetical protein